MNGPRALSGLEGAVIAGRFKLGEARSPGFVTSRYAATDEAGEAWLVALIEPALVTSPPREADLRETLVKLRASAEASLRVPVVVAADEARGCYFTAEPDSGERTLARYLAAEGRLDSATATRLLSALAGALAPLHAAGLAHRAITEDCILVAREAGKLKTTLAGFGDGLAQPNSAAVELDSEARLAPEIAAGERGGASADVWALAAVLHQMVDASSDHQLVGILAKCLDDDPANRPPNAAAFLGLLTGPATARTDEGGLSLDATLEGDSLAGKLVGDYEIVSLLGEGGMGAVYEVRDAAGEHFALKVIRGEGKGPRERRRFVREVKAASELRSENVARVLRSGVDPRSGAPFMVMELLRGSDAAAAIKRIGPLDPAIATRIAADACNGLVEAHARGLIHRDIKPPNLFLHRVGDHIVTKVCDFGIVKDTSLGHANTVLTRTGALIGSPSYMSPEQAHDSSLVDARTDIWSLSATLYEMLAGVGPWDGARNVGEILVLLQTRDVPPLAEVAPWVDERLAAVVHKGLLREPEARFGSAAALREALLPFACASPLLADALETATAHASRQPRAPRRSGATSTQLQHATPVAAPRRRSLAWAAMFAAVGAASAGLWTVLRPPPPPTPQAAVSADVTPTCTVPACIAANGGKPARCGRDGACVPLETEKCRVLADPQAITSPNTVWVGSMLPLRDSDVFLAGFGIASERAIDLARRDFASVGGLPARAHAPARAIGVISCDDSSDASASAAHLTAVGVPAVIGFRSSKDVIQLAQQQFIPHDVMMIPALNTSSLITSIPHPPNVPRLVYRTAVANASTVGALRALLATDVGGQRRLGPKAKLLLVRTEDSVGLALSESVFNTVEVGGTAIRSLGDRFRELSYDQEAAGDQLKNDVTAAIAFLPDIVIFHGENDAVIGGFLEPLERQWPAGTQRPVYLIPGSAEGAAFRQALMLPTLASRVFPMATIFNTPTNLKFTNNYNATFGESLPPSDTPGAPYDSFYLLAYAIYASDKADPTGSDLARALPKLLPPGKPTDVGAAAILGAFADLDRGLAIDLRGTYSRMDFDLETGESAADYAILCNRKTADGKAVASVESGLVYDSAMKKLTGTFNCK